MKHYFVSDAKFLELDILIPHEAMLAEARVLKNRFTAHRSDEGHGGWKSLSLYGLGENLHESWQDYGYANAEAASADFKWTAVSQECPTIMDFLLNTFPCKRYGRVRLMLVEAGGSIGPHSDTAHRLLENINIPLNNPKDCLWHWTDDGETLYMEPGVSYAMNISYNHAVYNNSAEDRFHLIIARHDSTDEWKKLMEDAAVKANITWSYVLHDIAT